MFRVPVAVVVTLVALTLVAATLHAAPSASGRTAERVSAPFVSPSENIRCGYLLSQKAVGCATLNNGIEARLRRGGSPMVGQARDGFRRGRVLKYGRSIGLAEAFRCTSLRSGMDCRSLRSCNGFVISRQGQRLLYAQCKPTAHSSVAPNRHGVIAFMSPSLNTRCRYFPSSATVACETRNNHVEAVVRLRGSAYAQRASHEYPIGPVIPYGRSVSFGGQVACTSNLNGMHCRSFRTCNGFLIAREGQRLLSHVCSGAVAGGVLLGAGGSGGHGGGNAPPPPPPPPRRGGCDPSYPTVCIPPPPPDLDCADVAHTNFEVLPPDPHGFDGNGDGVGCES